LAASPADAVRQAVSGTVTITDKEEPVSGTATFPEDIGSSFQISGFSWDAANARYVGLIELTFPFEGYEEYSSDVTVQFRPFVSVVATQPDAAEAQLRPAIFTVFRSGDSTSWSNSVTVPYSLSGTALSGVDYTGASGTVTIPAGSCSAQIVLTPTSTSLTGDIDADVVSKSIHVQLLPDPNPGPAGPAYAAPATNPATLPAAADGSVVPGVKVDLTLTNSGKVVAAPENARHDNDVKAAGGVDDLGTLPFGQGRSDEPGVAYTDALMVTGMVTQKPNTAPLTLRWRRTVSERSWTLTNLGGQWLVVSRQGLGTQTPADDLPNDDFDTAAPSAKGNLYIYDNPAESVHLGANGADNGLQVGDLIYTEKQFTYWVEAMVNGRWARVSKQLQVSQVITIKRTNNTGVVANDFTGIANTVAAGTTDYTMTIAKAAAITGAQPNAIIQPVPNDNYDASGKRV
jgi:hypothetical protein